jgi:hypothetical protein
MIRVRFRNQTEFRPLGLTQQHQIKMTNKQHTSARGRGCAKNPVRDFF